MSSFGAAEPANNRPDPVVGSWALQEVRRIVTSALEGHPARVFLFGSWAKGAATRLSDIDVGVLPLARLPGGLLASVREQLEESRVPYHVDLVDLSEADAAFRNRVLQEGVAWTA
ncbi:MAG: nucleotidyltransferase family protein [Myxococcota bacterium]